MRLIVDSLIVLMLLGVLAAVLLHRQQASEELDRYQQAQRALDNLREQTLYQSAMGEVELSTAGYPQQIAPAWFGPEVPRNPLASPRHAWIDIAEPGSSREHPSDPVLMSAEQAGFWYNPANGTFRARVPRQFNEQENLRLYNLVNGTALARLPERPHAEDNSERSDDQPERIRQPAPSVPRAQPAPVPASPPRRPTLESLTASAS